MKMTERILLLGVAGVANLAMFCVHIAPAATVRTVALSGQPAPGTASGVNYSSFTEPVLNAAGQTAFYAELAGNGVSIANHRGIWSEGSGALVLVARSGNRAPDTPNGVNFDSFGSPVLNAVGQTAFVGRLTGSGVYSGSELGIWSEGSGALALVARAGSQAPGTATGVNYSFIFQPPVLNAAGQSAFFAFLTDSGVIFSDDIGIWSEGSGTLALVARSDMPAPGTASGVNYGRYFSSAVLNDAGRIAFTVPLIGGSYNDYGVWSGGVGTLDLVARAGSPAPGAASGINFGRLYESVFSPPVLNAAGQTAFHAFLLGSGVDRTNDQGIWSEGSGTLALVARAGSQAPGTDIGANYDGFFGSPVLNAAGQTAFYASLTGSGVNFANNQGIWSEGSGTLALVAREGSQAPGTASGVVYVDFKNPALNAVGQTAFAARVFGSGVTATNNEGIWATDVSGVLRLIVRTGDQLEVAPGDVRTVTSLNFVTNSGNEDGRRSGFNDLGQLAFWARFVDGSEGIFVSNQVAIPEPASLTLAAFGMAAALGAFRPRAARRVSSAC